MSVEPTHIDSELAEYILEHAGGRDEHLLHVEESTAGMGVLAQMQTAPEQAAFLEMLVGLIGVKRAIEVGTFTGYGAIRIARGMVKNGTLLCCELDPDRAKTARANIDAAGVGPQVMIEVGPALETIKRLRQTPTFDFAYLDANKDMYPDYYEELVPRLIPGGLLAIDNVLMGGRILDADDEATKAVAALNDRILEDERVESVMIGMADGLTLVRRKGVNRRFLPSRRKSDRP